MAERQELRGRRPALTQEGPHGSSLAAGENPPGPPFSYAARVTGSGRVRMA